MTQRARSTYENDRDGDPKSVAFHVVSGIRTRSVLALHRPVYPTLTRLDNIRRATTIRRMGTSVEDGWRESSPNPK
jgi:hypothetical protein